MSTNVKGTIDDFVANLQTVLEGLDPNMGTVFTRGRRWLTSKELEDDATFNISTDGLFDESRIGNTVTRFWTMAWQIDLEPLSNGTYEFINSVQVTGFFQREPRDLQEYALNTAINELLTLLASRPVELGVLSTGVGYMGYLTTPPKVIIPVQNAQLDESGIQGHAGVVQVRYHEEVSS